MKKGLLIITVMAVLSSISIVFAALDSNKSEVFKTQLKTSTFQADQELTQAIHSVMSNSKNLSKYTVVLPSRSGL